jgi:hypothetical protein
MQQLTVAAQQQFCLFLWQSGIYDYTPVRVWTSLFRLASILLPTKFKPGRPQ